MRWHVNCFIWLMLFTIFASSVDRIENVKRSVNQFDEVADFADVIEPKNNDQPVRREARPSLFERSELAVDSVGTASPNSAPKKRSVSKKYSNLLDLKYYYSRGKPVRRHSNYNTLLKESKRHTDSKEEVIKHSDENSDMGVDGKSKRNSPLNILPIISDQNPYMSGLADATNDAYLKMRNYAATLMVILTTTRRPEVRFNAPQALSSTESIRSSDAVKDSHSVAPPVSISEQNKVGQARDVNGALRKPKRRQREENGGRQKKRRIVKKDILSFVNKLEQPAALQDVSNTPMVTTVPLPITYNLPVAAANPLPIQQPAVAPQNFIPAVATVRESDASQKNSMVGIKNQAPPASNVQNAAAKHLERISAPNTIQNQQIKNVAAIGPHAVNAGRPHLAALSKPVVPKLKLLGKEEKKETTENPFLWENNLLKEANIKVKRTMKPEDTVLENQGRIAADERKEIPIVTDTKHLEISSRMLTPQPSTGNAGSSCVINKAPESDDEQCNEEDEEADEECGMDAMVNNTCGGLSPEVKERRQGDSGDKQPAVGLSTSRKLRYARNANSDRKRASPNKQDRTTHNNAHNTNSGNRNRLSRSKGEKSKKQIGCGLMFSINQSLAETNDNFSTTVVPGANLTNPEQLQKQKVASKIVAATTPLARLIEIPTLSFGLKGLGHHTGAKGKGKGTTAASAFKAGGKSHKGGGPMKKEVTPSHRTTEYVAEKQMLPLDFDARRLGKRPKHRKGKSRAKPLANHRKSGATAENVAMTKAKQGKKIAAATTPFAQLKEMPTLGFAAVLHSTKGTSKAPNEKQKSGGGAANPIPTTTVATTISYSAQCMMAINAAHKNDNSTTN